MFRYFAVYVLNVGRITGKHRIQSVPFAAMEILNFSNNTWVSQGIVTEALVTNNIGQTLSGKL